MDKNEILEKSRKENKDEGLEQAEQRGARLGIVAFCCVFIFIVLFNLVRGQSNNSSFAMFWAFEAASAFPRYRFTGARAYLAATVLGSIASLASLICFVLESLG